MKIITIFYGKNRGDFSGICCYDVKFVSDDYDITPTHVSWKEAVYNKASGKTWCLIEVREYQENPPQLGPVIETIFEAPPRVERVEINKQDFTHGIPVKKYIGQVNIWPAFADLAEAFPPPAAVPNPGEEF